MKKQRKKHTEEFKAKTARSLISRLMRVMGIDAVYPRKRTTVPGARSGIYPYLLRELEISRPNQVWCADITYIPMAKGFMYLFAVIDCVRARCSPGRCRTRSIRTSACGPWTRLLP